MPTIEDIATVLENMGVDGVECRAVLPEEMPSDTCLAAMKEGMKNRAAANAHARFASERRAEEQRVC